MNGRIHTPQIDEMRRMMLDGEIRTAGSLTVEEAKAKAEVEEELIQVAWKLTRVFEELFGWNRRDASEVGIGLGCWGNEQILSLTRCALRFEAATGTRIPFEEALQYESDLYVLACALHKRNPLRKMARNIKEAHKMLLRTDLDGALTEIGLRKAYTTQATPKAKPAAQAQEAAHDEAAEGDATLTPRVRVWDVPKSQKARLIRALAQQGRAHIEGGNALGVLLAELLMAEGASAQVAEMAKIITHHKDGISLTDCGTEMGLERRETRQLFNSLRDAIKAVPAFKLQTLANGDKQIQCTMDA